MATIFRTYPMPHVPTVRVNGQTFALDEFNEMGRIDLLKFRRDIEGDLHEICAQIESEELAPQNDEEWLVRVTRAKRAYTRALRHIDATLDIRKAEHQHSLLQNFINVAREELPPETFRNLLNIAQNQTK